MQFFTTAAIAALAIVTPAFASPAPASTNCKLKSKDSNFTISNFEFNSLAKYSTPSHLATSQASVAFNIFVSAKDETLRCTAETDNTYPNYFDGEQ